MNDDMLNLAKKYQNQMIKKIGCDNISFYKGKIQNLKLDLETYQSINQYINYL
jgi:arsenite methyltransferase